MACFFSRKAPSEDGAFFLFLEQNAEEPDDEGKSEEADADILRDLCQSLLTGLAAAGGAERTAADDVKAFGIIGL